MSRANCGVMSALTHTRLTSYAATPSGWGPNSWAWRLSAPVPVVIVEYGIRTPGPDAAISSLSGGNVQRAVLARELNDDVSLLIASNPCFGLDFAAVAEIRTRIMAARNAGAAVLLISADLDEIFAMSDRIVVMSEGKLVHETPVESADLGLIGRHMAGHSAEA